MEVYKSQTLQDVSVRIHSIKEDGTDNTGDAANLSTIILDPAGNELTAPGDYTEATFDEIGATGEYECLFPSAAGNKVFTSVDQDNLYTVMLVSSTADIGSSGKDLRIVSVYPWETALEATLDTHEAARASMQTDLEAEHAAILAQVTGIGNRVVTIHVQDAVAAPLADVLVRIGTASQTTDVAGDAVFALDDGDYDVILRKDFVTFTVPESLIVAGDGTHPHTGAVFAPDVPVQPDTCVVFGIVTDNGGAPVEGVDVFINTVDDTTFAGELKIVKDQDTTSAADGTWQLELIRSSELDPGTSYQVIMCFPTFKFETTITVPDQDSKEFSLIAGT